MLLHRRALLAVMAAAFALLAAQATLRTAAADATASIPGSPAFSQQSQVEGEVARLYLAYFGRSPDQGGLSYWVGQRRAGLSLTDVSANFAESTEFVTRYGRLDDRQFIDLVYRNVLAREGDASGVRYWTDELGRNGSRGQIMIGFSESDEFVRRTSNQGFDSTSQSNPSSGLEALRNRNPAFTRYAHLPGTSIGLTTPGLVTQAERPDNGTVGDGQFRAECDYSHFNYDDPIIYPDQPGASHLHMFFGNTETNAFSTTDSLVNSGGGSCSGFELNRSAYWTPALLDGDNNVVVPDRIILYYKTKHPSQVEAMPQGLKMVVGNTTAEAFTASPYLYWSCGDSGTIRNKSNRIIPCANHEWLNATIAFPQCWDGRLDSADHRSHLELVAPEQPCPASHPRRLPQISILLYFPSSTSVTGWHLSSDHLDSFNGTPGGTLHADWWGGWNDDAMNLWTDGCMRAARNCSFGQTGTSRQLAPLN